jgi:type I restriction enzyme, S subunit
MSKFKRYERYKDSGVEWIGEIPEEWNVKKGRYFLTIYGGYAPDLVIESQNGIDYYKVDDLNQIGRQLFLECAERKIDITEEVKPVKPPVILIPKRGAAIFTNKVRISNNVCIFDSNVMGIKSGDKADIKYVSYSLLSRRLDDIADVSSIPQINNKHINVIYFPYPSIEEQTAIANFLDQKTAEIDGLIADKEKLIELLQEKRQAIITETVTKGLNPNVRLKDSGIEWIGEIPEHWNVEPIKYMVKTIQTGTTPTTKNDDYFDGDIQWFTPGDFHGSKELYEASRKISNLAVIDNEARLFPKNTVMIVGIGATVGKVAKLGVEGSFNQQITGLIVNEQRLNCDYLYYWLYINQETIKNISNYTTLPIINNEFVKNFECLSLPLDEQQAIVNYLNQKTSEIDDLILKIRLQIQKLKEYRQSLISEAVTGKIDVREFADKVEVI